ncbi:unnamed protein product [Protopolystoma xenopodis]|uniref:Uncharacterized protein n=1 Tax=Protopolystoma xenopodis TaxID=117903 RepID=A0A3S5FDT0_9PLAT|nr:unnamed protein product [Protopolystoma xenopodis]
MMEAVIPHESGKVESICVRLQKLTVLRISAYPQVDALERANHEVGELVGLLQTTTRLPRLPCFRATWTEAWSHGFGAASGPSWTSSQPSEISGEYTNNGVSPCSPTESVALLGSTASLRQGGSVPSSCDTKASDVPATRRGLQRCSIKEAMTGGGWRAESNSGSPGPPDLVDWMDHVAARWSQLIARLSDHEVCLKACIRDDSTMNNRPIGLAYELNNRIILYKYSSLPLGGKN